MHLNSDGENMTQHPPAPSDQPQARAAADADLQRDIDWLLSHPDDCWPVIDAMRRRHARLQDLEQTNAELRKHGDRFLKCDSCGQYHEDSDENLDASCECGRFLQRVDWLTLDDLRADRKRIADLEQQLAAKEREHRYFVDNVTNRFMRDTLVVLAGAVPTPEKGYIEDGGMSQLLADIKRLRKDRDAAERRAAEAEKVIQSARAMMQARNTAQFGSNHHAVTGVLIAIRDYDAALSSAERQGEQDDEDDEPICHETGLCTAAAGDKGISNCIHCGKELVQRDSQWFTWDATGDAHPQQQELSPLPGKTPCQSEPRRIAEQILSKPGTLDAIKKSLEEEGEPWPPGKTPGQPEPSPTEDELDAAVRDVPDVAERAASIGAVDPAGKTPGQVAYEAWIGSISGNPMPWQYVESKHAWEAAAQAVREGDEAGKKPTN